MGQRFEMAGRDVCEWALALFRTVIAGVAVVAVIGSFKFYNDFTRFTAVVESLEKSVNAGILPEADKMMSQLIVIVNGHQKTLERHERILDDIRAQND